MSSLQSPARRIGAFGSVVGTAPAVTGTSNVRTSGRQSSSALTVDPIKGDTMISDAVSVQNVGAWSTFASTSSTLVEDSSTSQAESKSSLWSATQSQEQLKEQREKEIAAQEDRVQRLREQEEVEARTELEKKRLEAEQEEKQRKEQEQLRNEEVEKQRRAMRAAARKARENEGQSVDLDEQSLVMSSMEKEFGASSFATEKSFD